MQIAINKNLSQKVSKVSELFGWKREEIVKQALLDYLEKALEQISLREEMKAWERLGRESWLKIEKSI